MHSPSLELMIITSRKIYFFDKFLSRFSCESEMVDAKRVQQQQRRRDRDYKDSI